MAATAIGLNVNEREVSDTPVITGPPIGHSAWAFQSERGPLGVAVEMNGFTFANKVFGEANVAFNSYFCLRGLWKNAGEGGAKVYGARVVAASALAAQPARFSSTADPTFNIVPGTTTILNIDGGGASTKTWAATAGSRTGVGITYPVTAAAETLTVTIDGGDALPAISLGSGSKSLLTILATLNAGLVGAHAEDAAGQVKIVSDSKGTGSSVVIAAGAGATLLGLSGTGTGTGDAVDITKVTAAEVETALEAAFVGDGLVVNILGSGRFQLEAVTTGTGGSLVIGAGTANTVLGLTANTYNGTDESLGGPTPAATTFQRSSTDVWTFTAGYRGRQDPGAWANGRVYVKITPAASDSSNRDVEVFLKKPGEASASRVEFYENLSAANVVAKINNASRGSEYVVVNIEGADTGVPDQTALPVDIGTGTAGEDGLGTPTVTDYSDALETFNGLVVQVVGNFDLDSASWCVELESYCSTRGDVVGVAQALKDASIATLRSSFSTILRPKSFIAIYRSYVSVADGLGGTIEVPCLGHVVGSGYVRLPRANGNKPHTAPAGIETSLNDVQDVADSVYGPQDLLDLVDGVNINPVVFESGNGFFVKTSRTMSTVSKWVSIHVRLLTNHIKVAFRKSLSGFEQKPNTPTTRRKLRDGIITFMGELDKQEAFEKEGGFDNNVAVTCDEGNNPQATRNQRKMVCDVVYRPAEIAENVEVNVIQTRDGVKVTDT